MDSFHALNIKYCCKILKTRTVVICAVIQQPGKDRVLVKGGPCYQVRHLRAQKVLRKIRQIRNPSADNRHNKIAFSTVIVSLESKTKG